MTEMAPRTRSDSKHEQPSRRRTKRIALTVAVEVLGKDAKGSPFTLTARATNLNKNGAMLYLNRDLSMESVLVIRNGRRARTSVRVVGKTRTGELYSYGIEFIEPNEVNDFWGISFPLAPHGCRS